MRRLNKGLCLCGVMLSLASCSGDKKLPQGERLSVLDRPGAEIAQVQKSLKAFPAPHVNTSWAQTSINPEHVVGNLKAGFAVKELCEYCRRQRASH